MIDGLIGFIIGQTVSMIVAASAFAITWRGMVKSEEREAGLK